MGSKTKQPQPEERPFQFQIGKEKKKITVKGVYNEPVINALKRSGFFKTEFEKSPKKGLLIHASKKLRAMVKVNMPCSLIPQDELLEIQFTEGEETDEGAVPGSDVKLFFIKPRGETENEAYRIILESEHLRNKNVRLAVFGQRGQYLQRALKDDGRFKQNHLQNTFYLRPEDKSGDFEATSHVRDLKKLGTYKMIVTNKPLHSLAQENGRPPAADPIDPEEAGSEASASSNVQAQRAARIVPYCEKALLKLYPKWIAEGPWLEKTLNARFLKVFKEQFGKEINDSTPIAVHEMLAERGRSVGYVTWPGVLSNNPSATCFVLKDEYIITNHHVIQQIVGVDNTQQGTWSETIRDRARVHFVYTDDRPLSGWFSVESLTKCYDVSLDYAILRLETKEGIPPGLAKNIPEKPPHDLIYLIGHPGGYPKATDTCKIIPNPPKVFEGRLREGSGRLCNPSNCAGVFPQEDFHCFHSISRRYFTSGAKDFPEVQNKDKLVYDTSFFWGASGSPVFTSMGDLIALHTCGYVCKFQWRKKHLIEFGTYMRAIRSHVKKTDEDLYMKVFHPDPEKVEPMEVE